MLTPDLQFTIKRATTYVPDARSLHFWDGDGQLAKDYAPVLHLGTGMRAWDVYLVYGRGAQWTNAPPAPDYLMDQLGLEQGHELNGDELAVQIKGLLQGTK